MILTICIISRISIVPSLFKSNNGSKFKFNIKLTVKIISCTFTIESPLTSPLATIDQVILVLYNEVIKLSFKKCISFALLQ